MLGHGFHKAAVKAFKDEEEEGVEESEEYKEYKEDGQHGDCVLNTDAEGSPCSVLLLTFMLSSALKKKDAVSCYLWDMCRTEEAKVVIQFNSYRLIQLCYFRMLKGSTSKQKLLTLIEGSKKMVTISKW